MMGEIFLSGVAYADLHVSLPLVDQSTSITSRGAGDDGRDHSLGSHGSEGCRGDRNPQQSTLNAPSYLPAAFVTHRSYRGLTGTGPMINIWDLLGGLRAVINGGLILALVACF